MRNTIMRNLYSQLHFQVRMIVCYVFVLMGSTIQSVYAQSHYYSDSVQDVVTVYESCDYRGKGWSIPVGEYSNLERLNVGNDRISSVRVPQGLELTLYKDRKFRSSSVRIDRDVACLNREWNNNASSLIVETTEYARDNRSQPREITTRDNARTWNGQNRLNSNVTGKNVSRVVFDNRVLQQIAAKKWRMANGRYGVIDYNEVSRDRNTVYLKNQYSAERIRIDLFTKDVTFVGRNGVNQRYAIQGLQAGSAQFGNTKARPNTNIVGRCFNYKAYTRGGRGGVKFQGRQGSDQFDTRSFSGKWCQDDNKFVMELTKLNPKTDVIIEIQGKKYTFLANEPHDVLLNDWYRKQFVLTVSK